MVLGEEGREGGNVHFPLCASWIGWGNDGWEGCNAIDLFLALRLLFYFVNYVLNHQSSKCTSVGGGPSQHNSDQAQGFLLKQNY